MADPPLARSGAVQLFRSFFASTAGNPSSRFGSTRRISAFVAR